MMHRNSTYPDIAKEALKKAYEELAKAAVGDFRTEAMVQLLENISNLEYLAKEWEEYEPPRVTFAEDAIAAKALRDETSDAVSDETPAPAPAPDPESEGDYMKKEEVRGRLATMQDKHPQLDIAGIMSSMGYQKLSAIPASRYQELLDKAEQAAKEIS